MFNTLVTQRKPYSRNCWRRSDKCGRAKLAIFTTQHPTPIWTDVIVVGFDRGPWRWRVHGTLHCKPTLAFRFHCTQSIGCKHFTQLVHVGVVRNCESVRCRCLSMNRVVHRRICVQDHGPCLHGWEFRTHRAPLRWSVKSDSDLRRCVLVFISNLKNK